VSIILKLVIFHHQLLSPRRRYRTRKVSVFIYRYLNPSSK